MPDLTTEVYYHCQSAEHFSTTVDGSNGKKHTVTWGKSNGPCQYDYSCTCDAFKFSKGRKPCKHILAVKASGKHCNWMQFTEGMEVVRKNGEACCPKCGLPAIAQRWGV